jgi:DNA-binding XRE family transcriptional regulator
MDKQQHVQLAKAVKERRRALGWSQARLAEEAGVVENTVGAIEAPARPNYDWSKKPRVTQDGKLRPVLDALGLSMPANAAVISLDGVPDDVARFLKVAVNRLKNIEDADARARILADIYPRIIVD